ncbi:stemmadenine O-acetyltransferase-like [Salvia miltiorrhiza]|uniref:stemmadenine O-acetyltransferase-like n=1 Tax=Salvia miltiorrhiza TaxID=226208 RepID=UPI0025ABC33F|nr:stemmadenine O-acetyltransferase-like [Salvia miltiorrhiza]
MEGFVQVISREMLKPSSQTPPHPSKLKLSYIDRMFNDLYIPLIFFYKADESRGLTTSNHLQISQRLKQSISNILPSFHPLAGRLKSSLSVDCNDAGAEFIEARARAHLMDSLYMDDQLKHYFPSEYNTFNHGKQARPLLVVQITFFDCGGLAVAVALSHVVADLSSAMAFLNAWAAAFRGEVEISHRSFGTSAYFPPLRLIPFSRFQRLFVSNENLMTKRFVFNKEKLDTLRQAATTPSESAIKDPSRVELVSAFIWKHFTEGKLKKSKTKKMYAALHAVNVRPRTNPPNLLENVFGNCFMLAMAFACIKDLRLHGLIGKLRSSIRKVRGDYITKALNKESFMKDLFKLGFLLVMGRLEWCFFTSWRGFPTYDLDYGWGKPVWFTTSSVPSKNLIIFFNGKSGDDIEAIVTMKPDDLKILDAQINLI